ncbi:MAG: DUF2065 domain-containing protein [Alphaproteobacteria bacterium]|nr:DUF2065 domain-containing protein [Alphaproteobacteria bacterium]
MIDFIVGLGLMLAIEGALYALFPDAMRRMVVRILQEPTDRVRFFGLTMAVVGVFIVWVIRM